MPITIKQATLTRTELESLIVRKKQLENAITKYRADYKKLRLQVRDWKRELKKVNIQIRIVELKQDGKGEMQA